MMTSRRQFLKITSASVGGALAASQLTMGQPSTYTQYGVKKIPTYCDICFWKCAAWVHFDRQGEIWKITGNEKDPLCNGRLCPRGSAGIGMYNDPDRLKYPLLRTEKDGIQYYRKASWPEALDFIAKKTRTIVDEHGGESIALFNHGSSGKHFTKLVKALGSNNIAAPSYAQCRGPREVAFEATFGKAVNSPEPLDIAHAKCLVLIGSHLGENMHNTQVQEMSDMIDRGAKIITVDPRLSTAASHSTHWLPIKPATDIALLLAWTHVLINEELYDQSFIDNYAFGLEELKEHVMDKTPEWAASICNLTADQIRETAWAMAEAAPATIIHPGRHVTWYGDDTQRCRMVSILNALLGSWGRKGGFFFPTKARVPSYPHPSYPKPNWTWRDTGKYSLAGTGVSTALIDLSHPDNQTEKQIKAWFVTGTNLIHTIPNQKRTIDALQNQELVVVVDTMPMEITGYADVVLPECTYLERFDDLRASPWKFGTVAVRMPAASPKYLSRPADWMVRKLGERLGLSQHFDYDDYGQVIDYQLRKMGSSLADIRKTGMLIDDQSKKANYMDEETPHTFETPTGMIELYSFTLEDEGFDPLPKYTPHPEPPEGYYRLNYGRAPMHTFAKTNNNPILADIMDENAIWINPKVAQKWQLKNGQEIWLQNTAGKTSTFPGKVRITERIGIDNIYMIHGFGHSEKQLTRSYGKGISDTELITKSNVDPIMGGTGMRGTFVTILTKDRKEVLS
ncbi:MAG: molybdopterin-dependent oxidoreductase [Cyclobacteriaceae bacterium]